MGGWEASDWGRPSLSEKLGRLRDTEVDWSLTYWPTSNRPERCAERLRILRYRKRAPTPASEVARRAAGIRQQLVRRTF